MWPTLYQFSTEGGANLGLHTYGLMVLLGFSGAFLLVHYRAQQVGFHPDRLVIVYIATAVGGIVGARMLYAVAVEPARVLANPLALFSSGGFAYYGGVLGGGLAIFLLSLWLRLNPWKFVDIVAAALMIGLGVGRLGCFFAGCCHGAPAPTTPDAIPLLPKGMLQGQIWLDSVFPFITLEFHGGVGRLLHQHLYPTQLWSVAAGLGLAAFLSLLWRWRRFDGQLVGLVLVLEPIFRILIETFRADHRGYAFTWFMPAKYAQYLPGMANAGGSLSNQAEAVQVGLTTSQTIGMVMMVVGIFILIVRRKAGVAEEIPVRAIDDDFDDVEI
jgi:phosphatidylglycerol---prolipoprotein diacylglyceryl transferase